MLRQIYFSSNDDSGCGRPVPKFSFCFKAIILLCPNATRVQAITKKPKQQKTLCFICLVQSLKLKVSVFPLFQAMYNI